MSMWLWINLSLGAPFVLAIVGLPLWLVLKRPDTGPDTAHAPAWRRVHVLDRAPALPAWRPARWSAAAAALAAARRDAERQAVRRVRPEADRP